MIRVFYLAYAHTDGTVGRSSHAARLLDHVGMPSSRFMSNILAYSDLVGDVGCPTGCSIKMQQFCF